MNCYHQQMYLTRMTLIKIRKVHRILRKNRKQNFRNGVHEREDFVSYVIGSASSVSKDIKVLEIGPYMSPLTRGLKVDTFDVLTYEQLVQRAISEGGPSHLIPEVTWVGAEASPEYIHSTYDLILSSHVVEHQIDFISHLQNISSLLNKGGVYAAMIPDHRYCFDHFNLPSTITDVLLAHLVKESNHSLKNFLEDRLTTGHNETLRYWKNDIGSPKILGKSFSEIVNVYNEYKDLVTAGKYVDVHAWKFTDESFDDIFRQVSSWGLVNLEIREIHPAKYGNNEFWVLFQKETGS
jgi:hypothetical protein